MILDIHSKREPTQKNFPFAEYYTASTKLEGVSRHLPMYPYFMMAFDYNLWQDNISAVQKALVFLALNEEFAKVSKGIREVINTVNGSKNVILDIATTADKFFEEIVTSLPHEAKSNRGYRTVALCGSHEIDGEIIASRAKESKVAPEKVAVFVFDQHDDLEPNTDTKSAAAYCMLKEHNLGAITTIGLPENQVELSKKSATEVEKDFYEKFHDIVNSRSEFIFWRNMKMPEWKDLLDKMYESLASGKRFDPRVDRLVEVIQKDPQLMGYVGELKRNRVLETLNEEQKIVQLFGQHPTQEEISARVRELAHQGITHAVFSIDIDVFDSLKMKLTVAEYTNWAFTIVLGMPHMIQRLHDLKANQVWGIVESLFFDATKGILPLSIKDKNVLSTYKNQLCAEGGMLTKDVVHYMNMLSAACKENGVSLGFTNSYGETFKGTITELDPLGVDYEGNTMKLVTILCEVMRRLQ